MAEAKDGGDIIVSHGPGLVHRFVNFAFQVSHLLERELFDVNFDISAAGGLSLTLGAT